MGTVLSNTAPQKSTPAVAVKKGRSAAPKPAATPLAQRKIESLSDLRRFFIRNQEPVYFVSATNFNLMNMDEWVHRFRFINYIDCFDGRHPNVFVPSERPHEPFECLEDIVNYLLEHPEVEEYIRARGDGGKVTFLFFDEKTEEICERLGLDICFPTAKLRDEIDNKMNTTRIGNRARVYSVPNVLAKSGSSKGNRSDRPDSEIEPPSTITAQKINF